MDPREREYSTFNNIWLREMEVKFANWVECLKDPWNDADWAAFRKRVEDQVRVKQILAEHRYKEAVKEEMKWFYAGQGTDSISRGPRPIN